MSEITSAAVDAARLYKEIKKETISELVATIESPMGNLHFGWFVLYYDDKRSTPNRVLKAQYEIAMKLNGDVKKLSGVVEYDWDTMPEEIGKKIFQHVLDTIKNNVYEACVPVINKQLGLAERWDTPCMRDGLHNFVH